jgi:hypothetical protein
MMKKSSWRKFSKLIIPMPFAAAIDPGNTKLNITILYFLSITIFFASTVMVHIDRNIPLD